MDADSLSEASIRTLIGLNNANISPNTNFIFGDPIATIQALGALLLQSVTGGIFGDMIKAIPFINADVLFGYVFQFVYSFAQLLLVIAWLANREA
jgi:hypothetical protein